MAQQIIIDGQVYKTGKEDQVMLPQFEIVCKRHFGRSMWAGKCVAGAREPDWVIARCHPYRKKIFLVDTTECPENYLDILATVR